MKPIQINIHTVTVGMILNLDSSRFQCHDKTNPVVEYNGDIYKTGELTGKRPHMVICIDTRTKLATVIPFRSNSSGRHCIPIQCSNKEDVTYLDILNMKPIDLFILDSCPVNGIVSDEVIVSVKQAIAEYFLPPVSEMHQENKDCVIETTSPEYDVEENNTDMEDPKMMFRDKTIEGYLRWFNKFNELGRDKFLDNFRISNTQISDYIKEFNNKYSNDGYSASRRNKRNIIEVVKAEINQDDKIDLTGSVDDELMHQAICDYIDGIDMTKKYDFGELSPEKQVKNYMFILNKSNWKYKYVKINGGVTVKER